MDFGDHLKRLVGDAGLTVASFAKTIKCHPDAPQKWFSGKSYPHRKYHKRMAEVLGVTVEKLLMMNSGNMTASIPAPVIESKGNEDKNVDKILFESLLSLNHRLDTIDRRLLQLDSISQRISSVERELADIRDHGAYPLRSTPRRK